MPRAKPKRTTPKLDMTPMVDLAFLLVTFFMLTTQFRAEEPVIVDIPSSTSETFIDNKDIMTITVDPEGKVFFDMDNKNYRAELLQKMGKQYNITFTEDEIKTFAVIGSHGIPMANMKQFLNLNQSQRAKFKHPGIPTDSTNNELEWWALNGRLTNTGVRLAIKGDKTTDYNEAMKNVIKTVQGKPDFNPFNLITTLEGE